jgi:hypothetical protein
MRLVIEYVGDGPRGLPSISVANYYEQNGDAMRDPEMVFEVNPDAWQTGEWTPVSYRQDNLDIYQEAVLLAHVLRQLVHHQPNLATGHAAPPRSRAAFKNPCCSMFWSHWRAKAFKSRSSFGRIIGLPVSTRKSSTPLSS